MRVLLGCERSGIVREEFRKRGHDAWSCDLVPADDGSLYHIQGDVLDAIRQGWDLGIFFPPCTGMSLSGNGTYGRGKPKHAERLKAISWTGDMVKLARKHCGKVGVENPRSMLCKALGKRTQEIQPWQFGHMEQKATWLWLYGLPALTTTQNVYDAMMKLPLKDRQRVWWMGKKATRGVERSVTYAGVAGAMADQWGDTAVDPRVPELIGLWIMDQNST